MWNAQPSDYGSYGGMGGGDYSAGGSGFMNSSVAGGPGTSKTRTTRMNNIFPSTCADILSSEQGKENFTVKCGAEVSMVSIVGVITAVNESNVRVDYEIDDFTGPPLKVKTFNDDDSENAETTTKRSLPVRTYVRVYGPIRTIGGERALAGFKVEKLSNLNEITIHMLQVVKARAMYAKNSGFGGGIAGDTSSSTFGGSMGMSSSNFNESSGLSSLQQQIQGIVRAYNGQEGISVRQICDSLRGVPEKRIRESLDFLSSEGHVYSTIDDDHFCATE